MEHIEKLVNLIINPDRISPLGGTITRLIISLVALIMLCLPAFGQTTAEDETSGTNTFIDAGCSVDIYGHLNCSSLGFDQRFGCTRILNTSITLGNLSPKLPIIECLFRNENPNSEEGIVRDCGFRRNIYRSYIVKLGNEFRSIRTKEEFQSLFAPVETQEEALSFAVALTNAFPKYDTSPPKNPFHGDYYYFPVATPIEPAYVEESDGLFKVHLFQMAPRCGCGSHPYYAIDFLVTRDGKVTELSRQKVYDSNARVCVD